MERGAEQSSFRRRAAVNKSLPSITTDLAQRVRVLVEAYDYAQDLDCDVWEFAIGIATLRAAGVSDSDLRWLICRGFVSHGGETTFTGEQRRSFRRIDGLKFVEQSSFVLTGTGRDFSRQQIEHQSVALSRGIVERDVRQTNGAVPHWDSERHELLLGSAVVKHFKLPAPNQEAILMAFQEEGWISRIDDPIPPAHEQDSKQRLRDTIKSLNRNQKNQLIRFSGDGSGQGVLWELID